MELYGTSERRGKVGNILLVVISVDDRSWPSQAGHRPPPSHGGLLLSTPPRPVYGCQFSAGWCEPSDSEQGDVIDPDELDVSIRFLLPRCPCSTPSIGTWPQRVTSSPDAGVHEFACLHPSRAGEGFTCHAKNRPHPSRAAPTTAPWHLRLPPTASCRRRAFPGHHRL